MGGEGKGCSEGRDGHFGVKTNTHTHTHVFVVVVCRNLWIYIVYVILKCQCLHNLWCLEGAAVATIMAGQHVRKNKLQLKLNKHTKDSWLENDGVLYINIKVPLSLSLSLSRSLSHALL